MKKSVIIFYHDVTDNAENNPSHYFIITEKNIYVIRKKEIININLLEKKN